MMRISIGVLFTSILLSAAVASAQPPAGGQAPPPLKNLQVFPKDTPRGQVVQTMQAFATGLGVRCDYCHDTADYSADAKPTKTSARGMMRLVEDINTKIPAAVSKTAADATRVQCVTCHRGLAIPKQLTDIFTQTMTDKGLAAAIDQYKEMRKQYYGSASYDFSEVPMLTIGQRLSQGGKPDDAITLLQMNLEFNPKSARTYGVLANVYGAKKDTANQIKALEKSIELDPTNEQAKQQLERLKKQ
jgi:tetratricopeptide (TPR) repeat protein